MDSLQLAWVAFVHALLFIAALGYAKFLNQPAVYAWYNPDRVYITVIGGDMLIWPAVVALYLLGLPWYWQATFYITLHCAAGLPIIHWQRQRSDRRRDALDAINRALQERT